MRISQAFKARPSLWTLMFVLVCGVWLASGKSFAAVSDISVEPLRTSGSGLAFCHSENRPHPLSFANAAAMAPPVGAEAGVRFGLPPAGLP